MDIWKCGTGDFASNLGYQGLGCTGSEFGFRGNPLYADFKPLRFPDGSLFTGYVVSLSNSSIPFSLFSPHSSAFQLPLNYTWLYADA